MSSKHDRSEVTNKNFEYFLKMQHFGIGENMRVFEKDVGCVIEGLPSNLKVSIHIYKNNSIEGGHVNLF